MNTIYKMLDVPSCHAITTQGQLHPFLPSTCSIVCILSPLSQDKCQPNQLLIVSQGNTSALEEMKKQMTLAIAEWIEYSRSVYASEGERERERERKYSLRPLITHSIPLIYFTPIEVEKLAEREREINRHPWPIDTWIVPLFTVCRLLNKLIQPSLFASAQKSIVSTKSREREREQEKSHRIEMKAICAYFIYALMMLFAVMSSTAGKTREYPLILHSSHKFKKLIITLSIRSSLSVQV